MLAALIDLIRNSYDSLYDTSGETSEVVDEAKAPMDDNGGVPKNAPSSFRPQETFQRTQETPAEHKFPTNPPGVIPLPRGSRGPRSLYLKRNGDSFGFTLRHFIVYPPDSIAEQFDGRHAAVGALLAPMDTIFVKQVRERSAARRAGLQQGDRLVAVNGVPVKDKEYSQVVQLIQNSPEYLHLLVVPKEEDVLQRFFAETAYNPVSNQQQVDVPYDRQSAQQFLTHHLGRAGGPPGFQVDAISWRSLQQPYHGYPQEFPPLQRVAYDRGQRSADSLIYSEPKRHTRRENQHEIYAEIHPHEFVGRQKCRAAPQVPLYRKMGRRASEGSAHYDPPDASSLSTEEDYAMKTVYKGVQSSDMPSGYPNTAGCRLSLDVGRRESTSSLSSSIADGSKDSLASYDSAATLTGHETDDSAIMTRFRKSVQQKEEFLRTPGVNTVEQALIRKEFYGRPKKLEKQMWPPTESPKASKPTHQNVLRVKGDIESERDMTGMVQGGGADYVMPQQKGAASPRERGMKSDLDRVYEAATAPGGYDSLEPLNGSGVEEAYMDDQRQYHSLQLVHRRARDFESGRPPPPDDDPTAAARLTAAGSELARLGAKRLQPRVSERAMEYDARAATVSPPPQVHAEAGTTPTVRRQPHVHRDSRSLDGSGSNASSSSIPEDGESLLPYASKRLSGNVTITSGSKYLHCPPPDANRDTTPDSSSNNEVWKLRVRSSSAESWMPERSKTTDDLLPALSVTPPAPPPAQQQQQVPPPTLAARPKVLQLDEPPRRPVRGHFLRPPNMAALMADLEDKPVVVKRRTKNTNIADDERATRRESYLKATEGGRMHIDSDLSDGGDTSPQVLRSAHKRWRPPLFPGDIQQLRKLFEDAAASLGGSASSSSVSLDREKSTDSPVPLEKEKYDIIKEGTLNCKILEIDGKRATDRSWKQVHVVLKGPKLFMYRDKHHQSPVSSECQPSQQQQAGTGVSATATSASSSAPAVTTSPPCASGGGEHPLSGGVDMRSGVVRVADEYTKRKHVARVSAARPCRSEFLLQADGGAEEFADWVRALQRQAAHATDAELDPSASRQQAVPQLIPASTTIQVQGSHLSPQLSKTKATSSRNRSPTGQSPVSKSRKPSQVAEASTSPKSKTWRGRMVKQFRKFNQGGNSPSSPTAPEGSTFGVALEDCLPSTKNMYIPRFVEVCTDIIDERGLQTVGIYRVPGNNASITALTEEINRNYEDIPLDDPRWNDLHVVSSLLKSYFRKMPDSLVTVHLYPHFIKADKIEDPKARLEELRRLVRSLPKHNYHTLRHIIMHLKRVADNCHMNRMEAKNLAIVFGPTIVRPEGENMETMVNHMTNQCKIVESLLTHAEWFFPENENEENHPVPLEHVEGIEEFESANNQALLLHNISKYEALKDQKEKNGALFSSIISAAQRKVKRKPQKSSQESKDEPTSPTSLKAPVQPFSPSDLKETSTTDGKSNEEMSNACMDVEKKTKQQQTEKVPWFNYSTDKDEFHRRIQNFKQETEAMLQLPRKTEISVNNIDTRTIGQLSSSAGNVHHQPSSRLSLKATSNNGETMHVLTKTHSACNVFSRTSSSATTEQQQLARNSMDGSTFNGRYSTTAAGSVIKECRKNGNVDDIVRIEKCNVRRGSSMENVNAGTNDSGNGGMKKVKYENENEGQRSGSLDSLNKLVNEDEPLLSTMTKLFDEKLKEKHSHSTIASDDIPYVDESPEKLPASKKSPHSDKENIPQVAELYRNPSLHKNQTKSQYRKEEKDSSEKEKEEDTMAAEDVPDNDRHITKLSVMGSNKLNSQSAAGSKVRRSESLNKPERTSPMNTKLKRSESLNKSGEKLKRSDSLSKTEKTESNINKRRELAMSNKRFKDSTKNKRKNGMPDRSIKRRHTVGGTKDPDKVTWLMDNKNQEEATAESEKEKNLRTSSPDLSSTRRDRFLFEINLIGPENMVVALRQHLIGARPQSFPESTVFKVPLESHV